MSEQVSLIVAEHAIHFFTCQCCFIAGANRLYGCTNENRAFPLFFNIAVTSKSLGHLFCADCTSRLEHCPLCAVPTVRVGQNVQSWNELMAFFSFPCPNRGFGCLHWDSVAQRRSHLARNCHFKQVAHCPFCDAKIESTEQEVRGAAIASHIRQHHVTSVRQIHGLPLLLLRLHPPNAGLQQTL